jgi:hypothetical protein
MSRKFADVVEEVQQLSLEEKEELQELLHNYLIEERRREIRKNAEAAMKEYREGELRFLTDIDEMMTFVCLS